jgi:hypothetical protein
MMGQYEEVFMGLVSEEILFDFSQRTHECGVQYVQQGEPVLPVVALYTDESGPLPFKITALDPDDPLGELAGLVANDKARAFVYMTQGELATMAGEPAGDAIFLFLVHPELIHAQHTTFCGYGPKAAFQVPTVWVKPANLLGALREIVIGMGISPELAVRQ